MNEWLILTSSFDPYCGPLQAPVTLFRCCAAGLAGSGHGDGDGDENSCGCFRVACLSYKRSPGEIDGRLIGNNGIVRALKRLSTSESLTSSEVQLALQAKMHRQEIKQARGDFIFIPGSALGSSA